MLCSPSHTPRAKTKGRHTWLVGGPLPNLGRGGNHGIRASSGGFDDPIGTPREDPDRVW